MPMRWIQTLGKRPRKDLGPVEADGDAAVLAELDHHDPYGYQGFSQELPSTAANLSEPPLNSAHSQGSANRLVSGQEYRADPGELPAGPPAGPRSTSQLSIEEKEEKLERLRTDIERARAEKEQMKTLNKLQTIEAQLKAEILKQQKEILGF